MQFFQSDGFGMPGSDDLALELIRRAADASQAALERIGVVESKTTDIREAVAANSRMLRGEGNEPGLAGRLEHVERSEKEFRNGILELRAHIRDELVEWRAELEDELSGIRGEVAGMRAIVERRRKGRSEEKRLRWRVVQEIVVALLAAAGTIGSALLAMTKP